MFCLYSMFSPSSSPFHPWPRWTLRFHLTLFCFSFFFNLSPLSYQLTACLISSQKGQLHLQHLSTDAFTIPPLCVSKQSLSNLLHGPYDVEPILGFFLCAFSLSYPSVSLPKKTFNCATSSYLLVSSTERSWDLYSILTCVLISHQRVRLWMYLCM